MQDLNTKMYKTILDKSSTLSKCPFSPNQSIYLKQSPSDRSQVLLTHRPGLFALQNQVHSFTSQHIKKRPVNRTTPESFISFSLASFQACNEVLRELFSSFLKNIINYFGNLNKGRKGNLLHKYPFSSNSGFLFEFLKGAHQQAKYSSVPKERKKKIQFQCSTSCRPTIS